MTMDLEQRRQVFVARTREFLGHGHDRFAAARLVAEAAGDLVGPALDIGTGKGLLAMALARRGLEVVSVDVSREDLELASLLASEAGLEERIRFLLHDARSLPFADGSFGCALMMDVLHHVEEGRPVLAEMSRLVGPSGRIVIADFTEEGFSLVSRVHQAEGREHPRSAVTVEAATALLAELGWPIAGETQGHLQHVVWLRRK
ncbi:MAG: class I SAM-dependent methyltransferase [Acidobacteria bacterium]|nr:class I SAM-dependent methyltransferase [Acidobacteriota bacterium]